MIKIVDNKKMGRSELGWLHSIFHFSFAEYYNPDSMQFGVLRVVNDDIVESNQGFGKHPHRDMEIVSYVVEGVLTHQDSMGNKRNVTRGQVQYMSAGTGVFHSEYNLQDERLRFLQIWILPDKAGYNPNYGDYKFDWDLREGKWLHIVSSNEGKAPIKIHQDMDISVVSLKEDEAINYEVKANRQYYIIQIEGEGSVNGSLLNTRDAAMIRNEDKIDIKAISNSHYILFDMEESLDNI